MTPSAPAIAHSTVDHPDVFPAKNTRPTVLSLRHWQGLSHIATYGDKKQWNVEIMLQISPVRLHAASPTHHLAGTW